MSINDLTSGILRAVNAMLIDILATMARQDYETRRKRQAQGIAKAKQAGLYTGKEKDLESSGYQPRHVLPNQEGVSKLIILARTRTDSFCRQIVTESDYPLLVTNSHSSLWKRFSTVTTL